MRLNNFWTTYGSELRNRVTKVKMRHMALLLEKGKRKSFFYKSQILSLPSAKIQKAFPLFPRSFSSFFLLLSPPPLLPFKAPKLLITSTPNCKRKPYSESWSTPLRCGTSNFMYGWTSSHVKFVGIGFLGAMMGSSTRLMPYGSYLWRNLLKAC